MSKQVLNKYKICNLSSSALTDLCVVKIADVCTQNVAQSSLKLNGIVSILLRLLQRDESPDIALKALENSKTTIEKTKLDYEKIMGIYKFKRAQLIKDARRKNKK